MPLGTLESKIPSTPEPVMDPDFQPAEQTIDVKQEGRVPTDLTPTTFGNEARASLAHELARRATRQELSPLNSHTSIISAAWSIHGFIFPKN